MRIYSQSGERYWAEPVKGRDDEQEFDTVFTREVHFRGTEKQVKEFIEAQERMSAE